MQTFPNSNYVNASGSVFNDIAGDQILQLYKIFAGLSPDHIVDNRPAFSITNTLQTPLTSLIQRRSHILVYLSTIAGGPDVRSWQLFLIFSCGIKTRVGFTISNTGFHLPRNQNFSGDTTGTSLAKVINPELVRVLRCCGVYIRQLPHSERASGLHLSGTFGTWYGRPLLESTN
jgi:hypothetical protein